MVVDSLGTIVQQVDYLPYGEKCNNPTLVSGENDYLYGGKEFQAPVFNIPWYDSQARFQTTDGMFVSLDPQCEKYYSISPYAYCAGNPVKYVDRDGGIFETAWDIANVVAGVASFAANVAAGNIGGAIVDAVGIVADAASVVAPGIPGGASAGIKAIRAGKMADKAIDTARAVDKGSDVLRAADKSSDALGTIDKADNLAKKAKGRYVNLPEPKNAGPGKRATPKQKKQILEQKQSLNGGQIRSDESGDVLSPPRRYHKGERADMNQAEIDHIKPRSKGGSNHNYNRQNEMCLKSKRNVPPPLLPWSKRNVRELVGFPNAL